MFDSFIPAAPILVLLLGGTISVVLEGAVPRLARTSVQVPFTLLVLAGTLVWTLVNWNGGYRDLAANDALVLDGPAWLTWALLLVFGILSTLLFAERRVGGGDSPFAPNASAVPSSRAERESIAARQEQTEVFPLMMFSVAGMMSFAASNDLITMFVSLELFSFPLYVLCGLARRRRLLSQEAALKYFLLGGLSSAIFLYGVALLYGYADSFGFAAIDEAIALNTQSQWLLMAGMALVLVGVLFKLGAAPFHHWIPDVYTGSPTPVTGFMAVCTKIAAAVGLLRLLYVALGSLEWDWRTVIAAVALLTMAAGALVGLMQNDVKRMLAYSSVAHAGFIMVGVVGAVTAQSGLLEGQVGSVGAVLFYLAAYGCATLGAFALVTLVRRSGSEASSFSAWAGLGRRNPTLGVVMTIFLLSMAGIPLTGGFIGKVLVFVSGWQGGFSWLVLAAVVFSLVTAGFYFRLVWVMFGQAPNRDTAVVSPGLETQVVIWLGVIGTIVLGVIPGPLLDVLVNSAGLLR